LEAWSLPTQWGPSPLVPHEAAAKATIAAATASASRNHAHLRNPIGVGDGRKVSRFAG
jgi:hypothetical protein